MPIVPQKKAVFLWLMLLPLALSSCATPESLSVSREASPGRIVRIEVAKKSPSVDRLTVETTTHVNSTVFLSHNSERLDLDLSGLDPKAPVPKVKIAGNLVRSVVTKPLPKTHLVRVEVQLQQPVSFHLVRQGTRVIVDLTEGEAAPSLSLASMPIGTQMGKTPSGVKTAADGVEGHKMAAASLSQTDVSPVPGGKERKIDEIQEKGPAKSPAVREKHYTGTRISLDFQDADLIAVLRLIAEVSRLNIITAPNVSGRVSLRLVNVPWDQALDIILQNANLAMEREGNVIRIVPSSEIAREREEAQRARKAAQEAEPLETRIIPVSYADPKKLVNDIKPLLTDRGTVQVDTRTSTLIVKDVARVLGDVTQLVKTLDRQTPQVSIEAKVVEVSRNFSRELGIQWGFTYAGRHLGTNQSFPRGALVTGGAGAADVGGVTPGVQGADVSNTLGASPVGGDYVVNLPAAVTKGNGGALGLVLGSPTLDSLVLNAQLSAAEATGQGHILSNPKITTLDNQEASIEQGSSIPYQTTSASGTQTQFVDATLKLTVTPHITAQNTIDMKIKVTKNAPNTSIVSANGAPSIDKKEATTEVLVRDGETTVIGGIYTSTKNNSENKVPGLGDIPLLGWLFKHQLKSNDATELLIFITPRIVKSL